MQYSRVAPAQTQSPDVAVFESRQKLSLLNAGFKAAQQFADVRVALQKSDADLGMIEDLTAFEEEHGQRISYTPDELKGISFDAGGREEIPAHEVRPFLLENAQRESMQARADMISSPADRAEWLRGAEINAAQRVNAAVDVANRQTLKYNIDRALLGIEGAQSKGLHDEALNIIDAMPGDGEYKAFLREQNAQSREVYRLSSLALGDNYKAMDAELERIENGDSPLPLEAATRMAHDLGAQSRRARQEAVEDESKSLYLDIFSGDTEGVQQSIEALQSSSYSGSLDEEERYQWIKRLQSGLQTIDASNAAQQKVQIALTKRGIDQTTRVMGAGEAVDPTSIARIRADVEVLRSIQPDSKTVLDFDAALQSYDFVMQFQSQPLEDQADQLAELRADRTPEGIDRFQTALKVHGGTSEALETDSMSFADRTEFYTPDPLPPFTEPEFVTALQERDWADAKIYTHYGKSSGPLTAVEAEIYAGTKPQDVIPLAIQVNSALGARAPLFWEQVIKGGGGTQFVAGDVASRPGEENVQAAQRILAGKQQRDSLEWTESNYRRLRQEASTAMGAAFGSDMATRSTYVNAALDHYIASIVQRGDQEYLRPEGKYLAIDSDLLADAVEVVTGGTIELDGVTMLAPEPGIKTRDVEDWIDSLDVADLPYMRQVDRTEALQRIQNGDIQLRPSRLGRDKFVLYDTYSGALIAGAGDINSPAVLEWGGAVLKREPRTPRVP